MAMLMKPTAPISDLIDAGAIFYVSTSGGKDSLAMYQTVRATVPDQQIVLVHATLHELEWPGVIEHIEDAYDHPVNIVAAERTLLEVVERRGRWPSAGIRFCTSDMKRQPIAKFIRQDLKRRGSNLGVNCVGLRAEESAARARKTEWEPNTSLTTRTRRVFNWHPILHLTEDEVFSVIKEGGRTPHYAYASGNKRLSCVICILGCKNDLRNGARHNPAIVDRIEATERKIQHTMFTRNGRPIGVREHIWGSEAA
jgi:DNA sulfur modification protein DndC